MKYVIAPRNLSLKVSQNILDEMYSKAFASFPNETGGMFAGRISEDSHEAIVERLVMPSKTESTHAWRKRSIPTHSEWLYPLTFDAGKGLKEA